MHKERIRSFVYERFPLARSRKLADSSPLLEEGVLDSLGVLEVVTFLQEDVGLSIDDDELLPENFASIDAIAAFTERKLGDAR